MRVVHQWQPTNSEHEQPTATAIAKRKGLRAHASAAPSYDGNTSCEGAQPCQLQHQCSPYVLAFNQPPSTATREQSTANTWCQRLATVQQRLPYVVVQYSRQPYSPCHPCHNSEKRAQLPKAVAHNAPTATNRPSKRLRQSKAPSRGATNAMVNC